jgi:exopolysaccharide biosynthesis polyprenyl glycosylphosphotransferase
VKNSSNRLRPVRDESWRAPAPDAPLSKLAERRRRSLALRRGSLLRRTLVTSDLIAFSAAFLIAEWAFGSRVAAPGDRLGFGMEVAVFFATLPFWLLIVKLYGLYRQDAERTDHSTADDVVPVVHVVTVVVWLFLGGTWLTGFAQPQFPKLITFWASAVLLVTLGRVVSRQICIRLPSYIQNTLILGADDVGQLIARKLLKHPEYGLNLLGFVDANPPPLLGPVAGIPVLGAPSGLAALVRERGVERVIIAGAANDRHAVQTIHELKSCNVQIDIAPPLFEVVGPRFDIHSVEGIPLIGLPPKQISRAALLVKRTIDVFVSSILLLLTAPLFAWIALRIRRDSHGPVFFRQTRVGWNRREIEMLKFRTMKIDTDQERHREYIKEIMDKRAEPTENGLYKLERAQDITRFGRWLRKTSLDELPQLINVLRGDMSLVGPRPCLPYEMANFEPHHFERFSVPAGITGLWQVTARARSTYIEALEMDVVYARGWSLGLDLWLLARTPLQMFLREGTK